MCVALFSIVMTSAFKLGCLNHFLFIELYTYLDINTPSIYMLFSLI